MVIAMAAVRYGRSGALSVHDSRPRDCSLLLRLRKPSFD